MVLRVDIIMPFLTGFPFFQTFKEKRDFDEYVLYDDNWYMLKTLNTKYVRNRARNKIKLLISDNDLRRRSRVRCFIFETNLVVHVMPVNFIICYLTTITR